MARTFVNSHSAQTMLMAGIFHAHRSQPAHNRWGFSQRGHKCCWKSITIKYALQLIQAQSYYNCRPKGNEKKIHIYMHTRTITRYGPCKYNVDNEPRTSHIICIPLLLLLPMDHENASANSEWKEDFCNTCDKNSSRLTWRINVPQNRRFDQLIRSNANSSSHLFFVVTQKIFFTIIE